MKLRTIVASLLLLASVGTALFCVCHINKITDDMTRAVETAMRCAAEQSPRWEPATQEVERLWARHKAFLHTLLPHVNLNELEWAVGSLAPYLRQRDKNLYIEQCVRSLQCLRTVREMEHPTWGNVF